MSTGVKRVFRDIIARVYEFSNDVEAPDNINFRTLHRREQIVLLRHILTATIGLLETRLGRKMQQQKFFTKMFQTAPSFSPTGTLASFDFVGQHFGFSLFKTIREEDIAEYRNKRRVWVGDCGGLYREYRMDLVVQETLDAMEEKLKLKRSQISFLYRNLTWLRALESGKTVWEEQDHPDSIKIWIVAMLLSPHKVVEKFENENFDNEYIWNTPRPYQDFMSISRAASFVCDVNQLSPIHVHFHTPELVSWMVNMRKDKKAFFNLISFMYKYGERTDSKELTDSMTGIVRRYNAVAGVFSREHHFWRRDDVPKEFLNLYEELLTHDINESPNLQPLFLDYIDLEDHQELEELAEKCTTVDQFIAERLGTQRAERAALNRIQAGHNELLDSATNCLKTAAEIGTWNIESILQSNGFKKMVRETIKWKKRSSSE